MINTSGVVFLCLSFMSAIAGLFQTSSFLVMLFLEMSFYSLIPVFFFSKKLSKTQSSKFFSEKIQSMSVPLTFFFFKVMGSFFLWYGFVVFDSPVLSLTGLLLKIGYFPFVFGLVFMVSGSVPFLMFFVTVVSKILPFNLISGLIPQLSEIFVCWTSLFLLFICGLGVVETKKIFFLVGWSSGFQTGVTIFCFSSCSSIGWLYFLFYSLSMLVVMSYIEVPVDGGKSNLAGFFCYFWLMSGKIPLFAVILKILFLDQLSGGSGTGSLEIGVFFGVIQLLFFYVYFKWASFVSLKVLEGLYNKNHFIVFILMLSFLIFFLMVIIFFVYFIF